MLKLPASVKNNTELKDEIKAKVIECAQGILHLLSLIGKRSAKAVRTALAKLSAGSDAYDTAYEEAMERIEGQLKDQVTLAKDALSWIVCSKRPLSTVELQEALAVETGTTELDLDNLPDIGDVISVCAGLVTVDEESHVIRLVHYTTQEYFERTKARWLPEAEALVTASCVTYLCFDNFNSGPCESHRKLMSRLRNNPLYEYAAQNWGHHARATRPLCGEVIDFLQNQMNLNASFEVLWTQELAKRDADLEWYTYDLPRKLSGLHLAAHFGIEEFLDIMMGRPSTDAERVNPCLVDHMHNPQKLDFNAQDSLGQTPLFYSVSSNMEGFTKALLELGSVEFDKKSRHGRTPLCIAAKYGYGAIVKWLVTKFADKIDIDSKDEYDQTPLSYAAERGHVAVLRCLLETGKVDIDSKDNIGQTSLSLAALAGNEAIARCLLETGKAEVNSKDKYGRTPLSHAAERGHIDFVKCLLEIGKIEVDLKDDAGRTPLSYAAENDNEAVVRCLLETSKVDVDLSDANSRTPFLWAVENGKEATARCLLNTGKVDINSRNGHGRTPLANAVLAGNEAIARFLIETDRAEVNLKDNHGQTPLSVAAERGRVDIVKSLLASGKVHVNSENDLGRTPLSYAAEMGRDAIVRLLLQTGKVEVDLREKHGQTPLYYAAKKGYTAIARCLLETGEADVNLKNKSGRTPLSIAAEWGHEDTVSYLLGLDNCKVDAKDEEGKTPLIYAIINSHEDTALRLLETGQVDVNARSEQGKAPLHYAIDHCLATHDDTLEGADTSVVELLIEVGGADPNVRDCEGQTVLWLAISYGLEELTEYLVFKQLVKLGADISRQEPEDKAPFLQAAARGGSVAIVKHLLENGMDLESPDAGPHRGANVNAVPQSRPGSPIGNSTFIKGLVWPPVASLETPLTLAARAGNEEACFELIRRGASATEDFPITSGTPLLYAVRRRLPALVDELLRRGADPSRQGTVTGHDKPSTPLLLAVENRDMDIVHRLIAAGAGVDEQDTEGFSPLHLAATTAEDENASADANNSTEVLKTLIQRYHADVNGPGLLNGSRPIHSAASRGTVAHVQVLLDAGAEIDALNNAERTPLHWAAERGRWDVVELLVDRGADCRARSTDESLQTPLQLAHAARELPLWQVDAIEGWEDKRIDALLARLEGT
ncbi:hypothetical protein EsH8_V_000676 [Colletotrichum jinshuiense]